MKNTQAFDAPKDHGAVPGFQIARTVKFIVLQTICYREVFGFPGSDIEPAKPLIGAQPDKAGVGARPGILGQDTVDQRFGDAPLPASIVPSPKSQLSARLSWQEITPLK